MSEAVFNIMQLAQQADTTTPNDANVIFPIDAGVVIDADRSPSNPDEDYGENAAAQPGRGSYGLQAASLSVTGDVRAEDFIEILAMHAKGGVTPTGGAGAYAWDHTWDLTSDTLKRYTIEAGVVGDVNDQWRAVGCVCDTLEWGFDALTAAGNAPWKFTAGIEALYRVRQALTAGQAAPAVNETLEGHMTSLYEGPVGTAFASLGELSSHLKSFKLNSGMNFARRAYGGSVDYATAWGRSARKTIGFTAEVKISATTKTNVLDVYEMAGSTMMERRWRVLARGSRLTTQNEVQTLTTDADGGTITVSFEGATTAAIAYNATTGAMQTAIRALPTMGLVTVSGSAGAWVVTFTGVQASQPQLLMTFDDSLLTKTASTPTTTLVRTTPGGQLKTLMHDMRVRFNTVNVANLDGERVYSVEGIAVKDATLGSDAFTSILNGIATIPSA